jgi:hypothetical protein
VTAAAQAVIAAAMKVDVNTIQLSEHDLAFCSQGEDAGAASTSAQGGYRSACVLSSLVHIIWAAAI